MDQIECPTAIHPEYFSPHRLNPECYRFEISGAEVVKSENYRSGDLFNTFSEGGLFEIVLANTLQRSVLNVCPTIIIRMSWSSPAEHNEEKHIVAKRAVFDQIMRLTSGESTEVDVFFPEGSAFHSTFNADEDDAYLAHPRLCLGYFQTDATSGVLLR